MKHIINSYFPVDNRQDCDETLELLASVRTVINNYSPCKIIWTGDFNCHFPRSTPHTTCIKNFLSEFNLIKMWDYYNVDYTCFSDSENGFISSIIDHFVTSPVFLQGISHASNVIDPGNSSDHTPIFMDLKVDHISCVNNQQKLNVISKPSWTKSTELEKEMFKASVNCRLREMDLGNQEVFKCLDIHCNNEEHKEMLDDFTINFLENIMQSADEALPKPKFRKSTKKKIPGWTEFVQPAKENAQFWNSIWLSCGKPIGTQVHIIMKRTRNNYHFQIRKCKRLAEHISKSRLMAACTNPDVDLFNELKKIRSSRQSTVNIIDGVSDNIENYFGQKYCELYNSADDHESTLESYYKICENVYREHISDVNLVTIDIVKEAISKLKDNKSDAVYDYSTDCFKNGGDSIADSITSFLIHGYIPDVLMLATLVPIVKDKMGDINSSKNYRSIAISNILLKIFDWVFIILSGDKLDLNDLQFAYQSGASTTMCSWMVIETINYYLARDNRVYACSMDYSKAFDRVLH